MPWTFDAGRLIQSSSGTPRYEQIADAIEAAIERGELRPGDRLPTVRALAGQLGVSGASVAVAYGVLARRGQVRAHVGRGTFVSPGPVPAGLGRAGGLARRAVPDRAGDGGRSPLTASWRRRALRLGDRLRVLNPDALVCTNSWPDPDLLPVEVLKRSFARVAQRLEPTDLQYAGPEPHAELGRALLPWLERDGVPARVADLLVMNSARQALTFMLNIASTIVESRELVVAVEEPGFHSAFDAVERLHHRLVGMDVDEHGVVPAALDTALRQGADLVILTPRALNPTGASWTAARRAALADVLAEYERALIVEDDHLSGIAGGACGSLLDDRRLEERVVYVRSFSKAMGPDLRATVVVARSRLRAPLRDAKLIADGWTPRVMQRVVAAALEDPELQTVFAAAREEYAARRQAAVQAIAARLGPASVAPGRDGVNIWVRLPPGCDSLEVTHNAAELGVLVSNGEPFYTRPGRNDAVRLSIGWVDREQASQAGDLLASAALTVDEVPVSLVV